MKRTNAGPGGIKLGEGLPMMPNSISIDPRIRRKKNTSEELAEKYLVHLGFKSIEYEPDGNIPPDFLVDGRIAVEVRRLNQNEVTRSGFRGLEEVARPTADGIRSLLPSLGPTQSGISWFVCYTLKRPLPPWKRLRSALRRHLEAFRDDTRNDKCTSATIAGSLELALMRAGDPHPTYFVPGGYSDYDSGGWVFGEIQKNLRLCIEEKTNKIAPYRHKYPGWWLILDDRIGYGVDDCDRKLYREQLGITHSWDKVILLNPADHRSAFEI
jgi:hypothetical protein